LADLITALTRISIAEGFTGLTEEDSMVEGFMEADSMVVGDSMAGATEDADKGERFVGGGW
jgi:hypothetical protein